ncbi:hypothetical protein Tco_0814968, partial [Tanacetum coccineum]
DTSSQDIVSSKGPSRQLLKWYDDTIDEDIPEFKFSKLHVQRHQLLRHQLQRTFGVRKPPTVRSGVDQEKEKRKLGSGSYSKHLIILLIITIYGSDLLIHSSYAPSMPSLLSLPLFMACGDSDGLKLRCDIHAENVVVTAQNHDLWF